jgi:hypothetical protein
LAASALLSILTNNAAKGGIAVLIERHNFELEIDARLFYLRADIGRHRLAVFRMWREPWRHTEVEWYDRVKRDQEAQARQKVLTEPDSTAHEEARSVRAGALT